MTTESIVSDKTSFAQNAFWQSVIGKEVRMQLLENDPEYYKIHQVDQYNLIAEDEDGNFLLINKSAIIAVVAPDTSIPDLLQNMIKGVKQVSYKPSKQRTDKNKKKFTPREYNRDHVDNVKPLVRSETAVSPVIQYKKHRTLTQH